jgi:DNA-binding MarR family transcriptional regulator
MTDRADELAAEIVGPLSRRNSTATVLFHHAVAERLGLGPSDHKCLDLVRERGPLTSAELAALTGLSTGAVTGVVARLERAGFVRREPDPHDGRKQILSTTETAHARLTEVFAGLAERTHELLDDFDEAQLATIAEFLRRATGFTHRRTALLRAQTLADGPRRPPPKAGRDGPAPTREDPP